MDIATSLGLLSGVGIVSLVILMGGDLHMFVNGHAFIVIFGGAFAATLIRFPFASIMHGLPLGAKFAFSMRRMTQRELVDELAGLAEIARKKSVIALEKVDIDDPFLAKGTASSPTATIRISSVTILSATATTSSLISTKARRSTVPSATAHRPSA